MRTLLPLIQKAHVASSSPPPLGMSRLVQRLENLPKAHSRAQERSAGLAAPGVRAATSAGRGGGRMQEARLVQRRPWSAVGDPIPAWGSRNLRAAFVLPQCAIQPRVLEDNGSHCARRQCHPGQHRGPRWALVPRQAGNYNLGSGRGA